MSLFYSAQTYKLLAVQSHQQPPAPQVERASMRSVRWAAGRNAPQGRAPRQHSASSSAHLTL